MEWGKGRVEECGQRWIEQDQEVCSSAASKLIYHFLQSKLALTGCKQLNEATSLGMTICSKALQTLNPKHTIVVLRAAFVVSHL